MSNEPETADVETQPVTTEASDHSNAAETFDRDYVERLRRENAKYRTERNDAMEKLQATQREAERAKMEREERLEAELEDYKAQAELANKAAKEASIALSLTGKVVDPQAAIKLISSDDVSDDGTVNIDGLLERYPFLRPSDKPTPSAVPSANPRAGGSKSNPPSLSDFRGMDRESALAAWRKLRNG